jgi:hypothetical protein
VRQARLECRCDDEHLDGAPGGLGDDAIAKSLRGRAPVADDEDSVRPVSGLRARVTGASRADGCWCRRPIAAATSTSATSAPIPKRIQPQTPASAVSRIRKMTPSTTATIGNAMNSRDLIDVAI